MSFNHTTTYLSLKLNQNDNGVNHTNCDTNFNSNSGCDVVEWSRASYGPFFEAQGGGVLAMKWDENDISVCGQHSLLALKNLRKKNIRVLLPCGNSCGCRGGDT